MKHFLLTSILVLLVANLFAQDPPRTADKQGAKDYPGISRYKGAVIQEYNVVNYTDFYFGLAQPDRKEFLGHGQFFTKYIKVEGKLINIQYLIPISEGVLKVYENYKNALTRAGYTFLYTEHNKNSCFYREDLYGGDGTILSKVTRDYYKPECDKDYYYLVAKGVKDSVDIYLSLYICPGGNYGQDFVLVNQSVVETVPLELGLVKADNIAQNIELTGHCIFYEIHFPTGSSWVQPQSDNQLKQIADYLKNHSDKKFFIVGHTDNVGDFAANMTLSVDRAKAVVALLTEKYDVDAQQIEAHGVADLCPISPNTTDAGKARNRRVELVLQ